MSGDRIQHLLSLPTAIAGRFRDAEPYRRGDLFVTSDPPGSPPPKRTHCSSSRRRTLGSAGSRMPTIIIIAANSCGVSPAADSRQSTPPWN